MRGLGLRAGLALNPDTPFDAVRPYLAQVDLVLCMTVFPGFGGQSFMADVMAKVTQVRAAVDAGSLARRHRGGRRDRHHHRARRGGRRAPTSWWPAAPSSGSRGRGRPPTPSGASARTPPTGSRVTHRRRAVVAGGGIIGTWHALELAEAGFAVDHLEAEAGPDGRVGAQLRSGLGQRPACRATSSMWRAGPAGAGRRSARGARASASAR